MDYKRLRFCLMSILLMFMGVAQAAAEFKDFAVIVNNQEGTLLTANEQVQGTEVNFGIAVADNGTVSRVEADDASSVATVSGKYHSDHGCTNLKVVVPVQGSVKILVGQCTYSSSDIKVTNSNGEVVASKTPSTACWKNDRSNVTELVYNGEATTLTITGMSYCPYVAVKAYVEPAAYKDFAVIVNNQEGTLLTANEQVQGTAVIFGVAVDDNGVVSRVAEGAASSIATVSGKYHSDHGCTNLKVVVPVPGSVKILVGQCTYSSSDIKVTNSNGEVVASKTPATACWKNDRSNVTELVYNGEATTLTITGMSYCPYVAVQAIAPKEKVTLDNEPATATFAFNLGTEGQKADFGDANDYFITSKVTYGSNLILKGLDANGIGQTQFEPLTQQNEGSNPTAADESNAIRFLIQPNFGFTFTPTKVSLKTTRYGTDNGLLDFSWQNPDGTTVSLAVGVKPNRNNETQKYSELSYDIEGATPGEGTCGLLVNLYHLQSGKQIGFADIVIEGTLSGTEKDLPVLATLTINGQEYTAAEIFDDSYEAEFELSKTVPMVSAENPVTVTAASGELGTITYDGDDTKCVVTIPMTSSEAYVDYVLTVVQKPDFILTYIDTDKKTVMGTQQVEKDAAIGQFAVDYTTATAPEGQKVRGWFLKTAGGEKYTTETVITSNINLYAVATDIEEASTYKKYTFDLTDKNFDANDHEAFNPSGEGFYWHDAQHGWAFKNGNKVDLLVGPKAIVSVTLCRYGNADDIVITENGQEIGTLPGKNNTDTDGEIVAFNYVGEGGTITLNMNTSGEMYIHGVKIVNTAETNYESDGNWYFVKAGDASSLIDVLEIVNGINASRDAERSYIFLPDGTYDLNETVKTAISGHNISIIGQSMENTIIVTAPDKSIEGLGSADMFHNSGSNLYLQDVTLKNALDYYGALSGGQVGGRAAVLQDAGTRTIGKNVRMLSYQDTYYSSNAGQQAYWENCDIHGTVDFICGGGDVRFQNTTISLEPRATNGTGGRTITAPTTNTQFGYVFDGCKVVDLANGKGNWNFGRTWQNQPICVYLNTTLDDNAANTLVSTRWTEKGMNSKDPKLFGEYHTMDVNGNDITPTSNIINSHGGTFQTIISAEKAAEFAYDKMFTNWDPASLAAQVAAPADAKYTGGSVVWTAVDKAVAYALFKNGQYVGMTQGTSFNITIDAESEELTIRAANQMGGFGEAAHVDGTTTGISTSLNEAPDSVIYNMQGVRVDKAVHGVYIINGKKTVQK